MLPPSRALRWTFTPFTSGSSIEHRSKTRRHRLENARHVAAAAVVVLSELSSPSPLQLRGGARASAHSAKASRRLGDAAVGHPRRLATDLLLLTNIAAFGAQLLTRQAFTVWGAKVNELIVRGQYWRLLTPVLLHGNIIHLLVNCASLNSLGPIVEQLAGRRRMLAVYACAGVSSTVASFLASPSISLGASGAVFGLGGALALYFYRHKELYGARSDYVLRQLGRTLVVNLVYGLTNPRIDNWGHVGGLLGGALACFLLGPRLVLGYAPDGEPFLLDKPPVKVFAAKPVALLSS